MENTEKQIQEQAEKLQMKELRQVADKQFSVHEAKMGSLFVSASFKNPKDKIKWDYTTGFIEGAQWKSDKLEIVKSYIEEYTSMRPEHDRTEYGKAYIAGMEKVMEIINLPSPPKD